MRRSREDKADTNQRIVTEAARLFRARGIDGTSVGDVMQAADKTHGGFYRHFESKEALLVAALERAFADMLGEIDHGLAEVPASDALAHLTAYYLSPPRVADVGGGCPVAALSGDVLRSNAAVRLVFGKGARGIISAIADLLEGSEEARMRRAAQTFSMLAGALMIARASDADTADLVLRAVRSSDYASAAKQPATPLAAG